MTVDTLSPLDPTAPTFRTDVDVFFAQKLPAFSSQINSLRTEVVDAAATTGTASAAAVQAKDLAVPAAAAAVAANAAAQAVKPVTSPTPPSSPGENARWIHSNTGREYTYLATANGFRWVETAASVVFQRPLAEDISAQINARVALTGSRQNIKLSGAGSVLAIGRNSNNAGAEYQGLQVGGGDDLYGADGTVFGNDGHASWMRVQPSKNESPLEMLLYPTAAQGIATATSGTNTVTRVSGTSFSSAWVGKKFYLGETIYRVAAVASGNSMTVTTAGGGAVSFGSTFNETFHVAYISGSGTCNVAGVGVTRVAGDPFVAFFSLPSFVFKINGTQRTVSASVDTSNYTLSTAPGNLTGAAYTFELDIDDQLTTLRLQKLIGSNEENMSMFAKYDGYWIASQFAGAGKYRPVIMSSGEIDGAKARQVNLYANGDTTLGGAYGSDALRVLARSGTVANRLETQAATTGFKPAWRARGTDANVGMGFDAQGTGAFAFTGGTFSRALFTITGNASANTSITVDANIGFASLAATSSQADADVRVLPKGTGKLMVGTATTAAATPGSFVANRTLAIKDASGTVYYLPCMAATW